MSILQKIEQERILNELQSMSNDVNTIAFFERMKDMHADEFDLIEDEFSIGYNQFKELVHARRVVTDLLFYNAEMYIYCSVYLRTNSLKRAKVAWQRFNNTRLD